MGLRATRRGAARYCAGRGGARSFVPLPPRSIPLPSPPPRCPRPRSPHPHPYLICFNFQSCVGPCSGPWFESVLVRPSAAGATYSASSRPACCSPLRNQLQHSVSILSFDFGLDSVMFRVFFGLASAIIRTWSDSWFSPWFSPWFRPRFRPWFSPWFSPRFGPRIGPLTAALATRSASS